MSYNIAIVIPPIPEDDEEAFRLFKALRSEVGPRPAVFQELHDRLTARYPCSSMMPEAEIDNTVWSDGPIIDNFKRRVAVLGVRYFAGGEQVVAFIVDEAHKLGLSVYDWGSNRVYRA